MTNDSKTLLTETTEAMESHGKSSADVVFIGSSGGEFGCTWEEYTKLADLTYDSGFGGAEIAEDLVVIFRDGSWLSRGEYDGSEWWNYNEVPKVPATHKPITRLRSDDTCWSTLAEINSPSEAEATR